MDEKYPYPQNSNYLTEQEKPKRDQQKRRSLDLEQLSSLRVLDLSEADPPKTDTASLVPEFSKSGEIDLRGYDLTVTDFKAIVDQFTLSRGELRDKFHTLNLSNNPRLGNDAMPILEKFLTAHRSINCINISNIGIDEVGCQLFAKHMDCIKIGTLDVSYNPIGDGLIDLMKCFNFIGDPEKKYPFITCIQCELRDSALDAFNILLERFRNIHLRLKSNHFTDRGIDDLIRSFCYKHQVRTLDVEKNITTEKGENPSNDEDEKNHTNKPHKEVNYTPSILKGVMANQLSRFRSNHIVLIESEENLPTHVRSSQRFSFSKLSPRSNSNSQCSPSSSPRSESASLPMSDLILTSLKIDSKIIAILSEESEERVPSPRKFKPSSSTRNNWQFNSLTFVDCQFSMDAIRTLACLVQKKTILTLAFERIDFPEDPNWINTLFGGKFHDTKHLRFQGCHFKDDTVENLSPRLKEAIPTLITLNLSSNQLTPRSLTSLQRALNNSRRCEKIMCDVIKTSQTHTGKIEAVELTPKKSKKPNRKSISRMLKLSSPTNNKSSGGYKK